MWIVSGRTITMTAGDFGIELPIEVSGTTLGASDTLAFTLKKADTETPVLTKTFTDIQDNTITLELTEEESASLQEGFYAYSLDWFQNGVFMCNLVTAALFMVVGKA